MCALKTATSDLRNGPLFLRILLNTMPVAATPNGHYWQTKGSPLPDSSGPMLSFYRGPKTWSNYWVGDENHDETSDLLILVLFSKATPPHWGERKWKHGPESGLSLARAAEHQPDQNCHFFLSTRCVTSLPRTLLSPSFVLIAFPV